MRYAVKYTAVASLVAGAMAARHRGHAHLHAKKGSPVEAREEPNNVVTVYAAQATETIYELAGEVVDLDAAKAGIDNGAYVIVGETKPTYSPPPPPPEPTTSSEEPEIGAQFFESKTEESTSTTSIAVPTTSTSAAPLPPKPKPTSSTPVVGGGIDSDFPSGKIKCSEFPSEWGAQPLEWLKLGGWSGLQFVPDYIKGALSISTINTGIAGETCDKNCMCSYACPPGYQKTQWSDAQGSTKQSIGGLYCNSEGYLELTRKASNKLCEKGLGGVTIKNELSEVVNTCRTEYPGTEAMVLPFTAEAGETIELTNPDQNEYYIWDGKGTSAQYYINKKGLDVGDACVWNSPADPKGAGNWSPAVAGVGRAADGLTYVSIFQNLPTSNALLDFNVEITGDVGNQEPCYFKNGKWSSGSGCTVS